MILQYYDNTMLSDYKKCPRMFYLRHVRGWKPKGTATALVFGLCWHDAMDILWKGYGKVSEPDLVEMAMDAFTATWAEQGMKPVHELDLQDLEMLGPRTPGSAREMLFNYIEKRRHIFENMKLLAAERPFAVPIYPDRKDIWYVGRRDKDTHIQGHGHVVIEHKTTTEYKIDGGFKSQYIESWFPNSQCEGYLYAANIEIGNVPYVWVDAALVHKKVHDVFRFIPVTATFANLDNWLWECRDWINRVQSEKERLEGQPENRAVMGAFPKNTEQCSGKYGLCTYLNVCRGFPNPAQVEQPPAGFVQEFWHPFDVLKLDKIGMEDDRPELASTQR